jgi:pimeloyl-ACP methyl ester carboxylesterase
MHRSARIVLIVLLCILVVAFVLWGTMPQKCIREWDTPFHWILFQEPLRTYDRALVTQWIPATDTAMEAIPCWYHRWDQEDDENGDNHNDTISPAHPPDRSTRLCVLYSHGNAENLQSCTDMLMNVSQALQVDIVAWDYSGYGLHTFHKTSRTPEGMNRDLRRVYHHVIQDLGYTGSHVILWGYSLGTGPSVTVAARLCREEKDIDTQTQTHPTTAQKLKGLILFGAYSSIQDVVATHTTPILARPFQPRWHSAQEIRDVHVPILSFHGQRDKLIPLAHGYRLKRANPRVNLHILPYAGHTTFPLSECLDTIRQWLNTS